MIVGTPVDVWVCVSCLFDEPSEPGREPWSLLAGETVTPGLIHDQEHRRTPHEDGEECYCEHIEFSWSQCEGCGTHLGGSRFGHTLWVQWDDGVVQGLDSDNEKERAEQ